MQSIMKRTIGEGEAKQKSGFNVRVIGGGKSVEI